jgi:glycosyltransferase involved in cell wall biosynthesis
MTSVLVVHESYAQAGGEDTAFHADIECLRQHGHQVETWQVHNAEIGTWSRARQATLFFRTTWSQASYRHIRRLIRDVRPDVVHFHNTLPLISPSALHAARSEGVPVVMTLHNYRLLCPTGLFYRQAKVCEDCVRSLAHGVLHGCYRDSRVQTAAVALMLRVHRTLGTWRRCVDAYIVMTDFMKSKMMLAGLPEKRIHIRPHFVTRTRIAPASSPGDYAVFLGRLSDEKGIQTVIEASRFLTVPVKIIGTGPLEPAVRQAAAAYPDILHPVGHVPHAEAMEILSRAGALLLPSRSYEAFPLAVCEAMGMGIPVIATDLGGRSEAVEDSVNGFLYAPGDARALADRANRLAGDPQLRARMGAAARKTYEARLAPEISYRRLMEIYEAAQSSSRMKRAA